ncbi:MAG: AAA family ATPase [Alphaproteobacteria bacterium]|nr:AAA family ATPase [Alphaproteobacteria bacterium]
MSDITTSLLPASRVDFFALDDGTTATARQLAADWRFARVGVQVTQGGIEAAIATYSQTASPEVIIVETNDISENFIALLGQLAGTCAEGTDAVIIGPMNDVHLYRSLVGMGVRDYLVRPVTETDLLNVIAKALVDKRGLAGARLVSVIGAKGGVGTTTFSQLLAYSIAETFKQKTMLMDCAGSVGSLGIAYGIEPMAPRAEVVRIGAAGSEDDVKRIIQSVSEHLSLVVCGGEPLLTDAPDADGFETLVNRIMQKYPVVVMDLSGATPSTQKRMLSRSAHIVTVTTPMLPSLRNCRTLMNEIRHLRGGQNETDIVINMHGASSEEVAAKDIKMTLEREPGAVIPYAPKIFVAGETLGKPVGQNKAAADIMKSLSGIASRASGAAVAETKTDKKDGAGSLGFLKNLGAKKK